MLSRHLSISSCTFSLISLLLAQRSQGFSVSVPSTTRTTVRNALHMDSTGITSNGMFELPEDGMIRGSSSSSSGSNSGVPGSEIFRKKRSDLTEEKEKPCFLQGDELHRLRQQVLGMRQSLQEARDSADTKRVQQLSRAILSAQQLDGEFMYLVSLERMEAAQNAGLQEEAAKYRKEAGVARSALEQFQLEGLWVGKYGDTFQMVNISYTGDVLTAHKVTGDQHVPKGEITFQVDLSPSSQLNNNLDPIELSSEAVEQWGSKYLQRHAGQGQVAADGFQQAQWMPGQLILVNQYFSFAWLPTGHQVFFGRPSAELTLKLLRESSSQRPSFDDADDNNRPRQFLARCMEETALLDDDMEVSDGIFRSHDQHYYYEQAGCFE